MATRVTRMLASSWISFFRLLWRVSRQVFHESVGALFILLAIGAGVSAWRQWSRGTAEWLAGLAIGFALMMLAFGITSFRISRRIRED